MSEIDYYIDPRLQRTLDEKIIPSLHQKDKDCVLAIDGIEGGGKSTFAFQIGKYVDPTLDVSRVVFTAEEFKEAIYKAKKGQCVIFDEAFTGLSSRASLSGINKMLVSLMMQMRQKNLFVLVVLPTFFLLDKYVALFRAKALIHVYESKGRRGYFSVFNRKNKKILFLTGRQTYSYSVKTRYRGRFYGKFALGGEEVEEEYRAKKARALEAMGSDSPIKDRFKEQRDLLIYHLYKDYGLSYRKQEAIMKEFGFDLSYVAIMNVCNAIEKEKNKEKEESETVSSQNIASSTEKDGK